MIGKGTFARIFRASDIHTNEKVAIKVEDTTQVPRFVVARAFLPGTDNPTTLFAGLGVAQVGERGLKKPAKHEAGVQVDLLWFGGCEPVRGRRLTGQYVSATARGLQLSRDVAAQSEPVRGAAGAGGSAKVWALGPRTDWGGRGR